MGKVVAGASMSLDGYVAGPDQSGFEHLFDWYNNGDVAMPVGGEGTRLDLKMSQVSASRFTELIQATGALVVGRFLYDQTNGWDGEHPMQCPVVVLTHNPPEQHSEHFVFVTEGIEAAVAKAKEIAGDKNVGLNSGTITRQALDAGLVDELEVDLVPVILGGGTPFFGAIANVPVKLQGPVSVIEGTGVTHLSYLVTKG
ncbi:dihydrofolate reductase family protein [Kibdelosporangium philippinense]|uniref:Dihydrofolate reductase family protein n=1 Tax=Kibdelosporangium philippinense TaxID=211113 RepID=A0ABS8Z1Z9_9PSEU|nr:dihydrofolate reductase family protein [Kibdelosporangium philippinense]MCE7001387.1 dihydrofolate reductase family protein [Kibdelosporangium philippinense]